MKWYRKEHRDLFLVQLKKQIERIEEERNVLKYSPLAFKYARKTNLEESRVGILNVQDVEQSAFEGLCDIWRTVDWEKIDKSDEPEKTLVNYLSARITRTIKREIYGNATGVAIPEYQITRTKKQEAVDKLFGNWLYSFKVDGYVAGNYRYSDAIMAEPETNYSDIMELNDLLTDEMNKYLKPKEREILRMHFGVMYVKKMPMKAIAEELKMSVRGVEDAKSRALKKLLNNSNREIFKKFL